MQRDRLVTLKSVWPFLAILAALVIFYFKMVTVQGAWLLGDHAEQHFPWAVYLADHLRSGKIPFWTSLTHTGFPITAEGQIGSLYLPNIFFYTLFPIQYGYAWNILFHFVLSAFFMLSFMRSLGLDKKSAFLGIFVYLFGSTLGGAYYNITSLKVLTWFPLTLFVADQIIRSNRFPWRWILLEGFLFSLEILAGYLQFATYAVLFTCLYTLFRFLEQPDRKGTSFLRTFLFLGLAVAIAALIASPQLLWTYELAIRSTRAETQEGFAYVGSYSPFTLICLFFPSLEGLFVSKLYLGILPLFFVIATFFHYRFSNIPKSIYWLALTAFILALGRFSPLYVLLVKTLHFYAFRTPIKLIFFAGFFLSILSGFGLQAVLRRDNGKTLLEARKVFFISCLLALGGVLTAYACFRYGQPLLHRLGEWLVREFIYGTSGHPFAWEHYEARLASFMQVAQQSLDPRGKVFIIPALKIGAVCLFILFYSLKKIGPRLFYAVSLVMLVIDLQWSYADVQGDYASYASFFEKNGAVRFLEGNLGENDRYFNYSTNPSESPLPTSKNMIYGLKSVNAYSPFVLKDYYDFFSSLGGINNSIGYHPVEDVFLYQNLKLLGILNVKYIVTDRLLTHPKLRSTYKDGGWFIYENLTLLPPFLLIPNYRVVADRKTLLQEMRKPDYDPSALIFFEEAPYFLGAEGKATVDEVKVVRQSEDRIEWVVSSHQDQILLIPKIHYPGWRVQIDGETGKLYRADFILDSIPIRKGRHHIAIWYAPEQFPVKREIDL